MVVLMILMISPSKMGWIDMPVYFPWTIAAALTFLFGIVNTLLSLSSSSVVTYWRDSIMAYGFVLLSGALMAWGLSGLDIWEAKSFSWIYKVFTIAYILIMSIVQTIRRIVTMVQDQDAQLRKDSRDN